MLLTRALDAEVFGPAMPGPVVAAVESTFGSYALIRDRGGVRAVELNLDHADVRRRAAGFRLAVEIDREVLDPAHRVAAARLVDATLAWLWDAVAAPVLAALGPARRL